MRMEDKCIMKTKETRTAIGRPEPADPSMRIKAWINLIDYEKNDMYLNVREAYWICRGSVIDQQVIIGTHGKLKNWQSKRMLSYRTMKILVLDEADEMLKVSSWVLLQNQKK